MRRKKLGIDRELVEIAKRFSEEVLSDFTNRDYSNTCGISKVKCCDRKAKSEADDGCLVVFWLKRAPCGQSLPTEWEFEKNKKIRVFYKPLKGLAIAHSARGENKERDSANLKKLVEGVDSSCKACKGTGGKPSNPCKSCDGSGQVRPKPIRRQEGKYWKNNE